VSSTELVERLNDGHGWLRDMVQRLLVERNDTSVVDYLRKKLRPDANIDPFARFQLLWILDEFHANDRDVLRNIVNERDVYLENEIALRLLEPEMKSNATFREQFGKELVDNLKELSPRLQLALSARFLNPQHAFSIYKYVLEEPDTPIALMPDAVLSGLSGKELSFFKDLLRDDRWKQPDAFKLVFIENLSTTILRRRDPRELSELYSLVAKTPNPFQASVLTATTVQGRGKWKPLKLTSAPAVLKNNLPSNQSDVINNMFEWPGHKVDLEAIKASVKLTEPEQKLFAEGRQQYLGVCSGCHGGDGQGMQRLGPPLAGSEWVLGDERRLALLVLHGIEGPIDVAGKRYDAPNILPVMPSHSTMDDAAITSILVYIRNEWGNNAGGVNRRTVGRLRHTTQGRVQPWSVQALNEHMEKIDTVKIE
jgi:mono/diheme cytochrome c family protein